MRMYSISHWGCFELPMEVCHFGTRKFLNASRKVFE